MTKFNGESRGVKRYGEDRGDIVWINFDPQTGREQAGHRPALVISPKLYNSKVGLALICPITSGSKGYPFEVKLKGTRIKGVILSDQIKSFDWRARRITFISKVSRNVLLETQEKIKLLVS